MKEGNRKEGYPLSKNYTPKNKMIKSGNIKKKNDNSCRNKSILKHNG